MEPERAASPSPAAAAGAAPSTVAVPAFAAADLPALLRDLSLRVERSVDELSRRHRRLMAGAIALSLASSVLAAAVAVFGPAVLDGLRAQGASNPALAWQVPCFVIAVLSAASAAASNFQSGADAAGGLAEARQALGKVRALIVAQQHRAEPEILLRLEELVAAHPQVADAALLSRLRSV